jgi:hypothetical protein
MAGVIAAARRRRRGRAQALGAEAQAGPDRRGAVAGSGWKLDGETLDVAIYNAGVIGPRTKARSR